MDFCMQNQDKKPDNYSAADLKIGEEGIAAKIIDDNSLKQRLVSMGIFTGATITAPKTSVFSNPRTYVIKGCQICMRTNEQ